jgi:hypothetical protein
MSTNLFSYLLLLQHIIIINSLLTCYLFTKLTIFISIVHCHVDCDFVTVDKDFKYETEHETDLAYEEEEEHYVENGDPILKSEVKAIENGAIPEVFDVKSDWRGLFNSEKSMGKSIGKLPMEFWTKGSLS